MCPCCAGEKPGLLRVRCSLGALHPETPPGAACGCCSQCPGAEHPRLGDSCRLLPGKLGPESRAACPPWLSTCPLELRARTCRKPWCPCGTWGLLTAPPCVVGQTDASTVPLSGFPVHPELGVCRTPGGAQLRFLGPFCSRTDFLAEGSEPGGNHVFPQQVGSACCHALHGAGGRVRQSVCVAFRKGPGGSRGTAASGVLELLARLLDLTHPFTLQMLLEQPWWAQGVAVSEAPGLPGSRAGLGPPPAHRIADCVAREPHMTHRTQMGS